MKWKNYVEKGKNARVVKRFLVFPKRLDGEWRWFEKARIIQSCCRGCGDETWLDWHWFSNEAWKAVKDK